MTEFVKIGGRHVRPHKATSAPQLGARNVLTNSHWEYVALWLRRKRKTQALFYWEQAHIFALASNGLPVESAPLLLYYSFMNAVKALLSSRGVAFGEHHGIRSHNMRGATSKIALSNEGVRILQHGIAPALSQHLGETEPTTTHSLEDLLFNLPCIHRTFCITYTRQEDMFIPLTDCHLAFDRAAGIAYFSAKLSEDFLSARYVRRLPASLSRNVLINDGRSIRSTAGIHLSSPTLDGNNQEIAQASAFLSALRPDLNYIAGAQTLWYAKTVVPGPSRLARSPLTCTLLAMHRLSEICRYRPMQLASFLSGQKNWLLTEFIRMSPPQFLDEISAELTGQQFMTPNVRSAT
jgi:hypothetical protein